jgi:predicted DNA-binding transcriptional regulator YafY
MLQGDQGGPGWSLLSSHGVVLFYLATHPDSTLRDLSQQVGLTERTVYRVIHDLSTADMVHTRKVGRRNSYVVNPEAHFVQPMFAHLQVGALIGALYGGRERPAS